MLSAEGIAERPVLFLAAHLLVRHRSQSQLLRLRQVALERVQLLLLLHVGVRGWAAVIVANQLVVPYQSDTVVSSSEVFNLVAMRCRQRCLDQEHLVLASLAA